MAYTKESVKVESIESFIKKEAKGISNVLNDYYAWLKSIKAKRYKHIMFNYNKPTLKSFLYAFRLNPKSWFPLVRRMLPNEKAKRKVSVKKVSVYLHADAPLFTEFEDVTGKKVPIHSVLSTFADEPDWGFDHSLFQIKEYGYGKQPYGKPMGESSKAPFHMQFSHEPWIVRTFASEVTQGMVHQRVELFRRMAKFAKQTGHDYWAYRFSAWTIHYLQDLAQIYHSRAVPHGGFWYYTNFMFSFGIIGDSKADIKRKTTQLVANRHFIYEDFVAYGLETFYTKPTPLLKRFEAYLNSGKAYQASKDMQSLLKNITKFANDHSGEMDEVIVKVFGDKYTDDDKYDLETDKNYDISKIIPTLNKEKGDKLLKETGKDFQMTSQATRTALKFMFSN